MRYHKKSARRSVCQDVDPDFAAALMSDSSISNRQKPDHKTLQLCAQVQNALTLALAGECNDDLLRDLYIDTVEPAPNASRLLVRLVIPKHAVIDIADFYERIARVSPFLRSIVAREISRKRTPELSFIAIPESQVMS